MSKIQLSEVRMVPLEYFRPHPRNKYPSYTAEQSHTMAKSILENGVLDPINAIDRNGEFAFILDGFNRWHSSNVARNIDPKVTHIPTRFVLNKLSDKQVDDYMMNKNCIRRGEDFGFKSLVEKLKANKALWNLILSTPIALYGRAGNQKHEISMSRKVAEFLDITIPFANKIVTKIRTKYLTNPKVNMKRVRILKEDSTKFEVSIRFNTLHDYQIGMTKIRRMNDQTLTDAAKTQKTKA